MDGAGLTLRVLTPSKKVLERPADFVILRCAAGDKGVLPGHERYVARLAPGMLRVYMGKELSGSLFVMGGTVRVEDDQITVLTEMAGGVEEVKLALRQVEARLEQRRQEELRSDVEIRRAEAALRNALVLMDVNPYTVMSTQRDAYER